MPAPKRSDRRRTHNVTDEMLQKIAVADIQGSLLNAIVGSGQFDAEECESLKQRHLAERIELRTLLLDWLGENHLFEVMDLYELSLRQIDPANPSDPYRRRVSERPFLRRLILLSAFRSECTIASKIRADLEVSRAESMAESGLLEILASNWVVVSPRTARVISHVDAWAVAIGNHQTRFPALSEEEVMDFIRNHAAVLFAEHDAYLSLRRQNNVVELNVVRLFADLGCACSFGESNGQRWATNLKTQQIIDVNCGSVRR